MSDLKFDAGKRAVRSVRWQARRTIGLFTGITIVVGLVAGVAHLPAATRTIGVVPPLFSLGVTERAYL